MLNDHQRFDRIHSHPANQVFHIVFFPDRVYHAQYLNASRSARYRYNVQEVRGKSEANVLKGEVYMDEAFLSNFIRIEYRGARLVEASRQKNRLLQDELVAWVKLYADSPRTEAETRVKLSYCPWIDAYQTEIWTTLEPPAGTRHDIKVLDAMGRNGSITRIPAFSPLLRDISRIFRLELAFRENTTHEPFGYGISEADAAWDNFYERNIQKPNTVNPSDPANTVKCEDYQIDFRRGYYFGNVRDLEPVRYRNAMMNDNDSERSKDNVIEMRWILQQELGTEMVFFHEVTIPPGHVEGTHQHIGSEELYYITEGKGIAYFGENDAPEIAASTAFPTVKRSIFGLDERSVKELPVEPGSVIFTKSGGIHGIRNTSTDKPLRFVAFLYHAS